MSPAVAKTPAEVVRLLVQLTKPQAGQEADDPTVGSGGFLIQTHQYVEEQGQDKNDLHLFGQDSNGTVWSDNGKKLELPGHEGRVCDASGTSTCASGIS